MIRRMDGSPESSLPEDVAALQSLLVERDATIVQQRETIAALSQTIGEQAAEKERLLHRLAVALRQRYGQSRERFNPDQALLFDKADLDALEVDAKSKAVETPVVAEVDAPAEPTKKPKKRGHGRRQIPEHLPREVIRYELPVAQRACPCCSGERVEFAVEASEQLEFIPARFIVLRHERVKYVCKSCQEQVVVADKPPQPIDKGLPGPGLLAECAVGKFGDHLPTYRLEDKLARSGLIIRRSTIGGWLVETADLLEPLYRLMIARVLASRVIHTDDTTVPLLDPLLDKTRTARFWGYLGDKLHPYVVYDFTESRKRDGPQHFLKDFQGYLQADAYGGYDGIYHGGQVYEVACWAHARRKWFDVKTLDPVRAHHALATVGRLYKIEDELKDATTDERRDARQARALPILHEFKAWLDVESPKLLPKNPVAQAAGYALNQWAALVRYCEDGDLSIDNNAAERVMKPAAIGRKNWLFVGSPLAGHRAAVLMSFIATCKHNQVEPWAYLKDILTTLPQLGPAPTAEQLAPLLPDAWLITHSSHRWEIDALRKQSLTRRR